MVYGGDPFSYDFKKALEEARMPYKSKAQRRKFHADPKLRKLVPEFDAASKGLKLPERAKAKKK